MRLTIELIPSTCWYVNVRSSIGPKKWDQLRRETYNKASNKCEICGNKGSKWSVEAHEIFEYDDLTYTQKFIRLIALCPDCHAVKHLGRSMVCGKLDSAILHLSKTNGWTRIKAKEYIDEQFGIWQKRSKYSWKLDLTLLETK